MPIIDDRIVEMLFDNSEFDPNIKKSQKTLEEFEKSLDTKKFEKYADKLNGENFNGLQKALAGLGNTFQTMQTVAVGALLNIGAKIENFVSSSLRRMTIDPLVQGWSAYAEKVTSVQTIMAATRNQFQDMADALERGDEKVRNLVDSTGQLYTAAGLMADQMKYVNGQLEELMAFTDETSASYQVMVNNIGKFTSQNIDLKTSVKAMEGIATWANLSGANAEQMSRAMYNISQSLGVGRMLTRDWMSIENANMATVEFKESVIDAAVALGKLQKDANGVVKTLNGKMQVTVSNFRDTLSEDWFTSDVLISALDRYGGFSQEIIALSKETDKSVHDVLYDAINPLAEGTKTVEEAMADLGLEGEETLKTLEKLASAEYDLGRRAFEASYESKTLGDAINYVGDAIKTGWIKTYEYIIGDYKEAKQFWTEFAEILYTLFVRAGELRNEVLQIWKALDGRKDLIEGLKNIWETIEQIGKTIGEVLGEFFPQLKDSETGVRNVAAVLIALTRKFKEFTQKLKENKPLMEAVSSGARILGHALKGLLEIARLLYIFLGPTVRFTKQLLTNILKLVKPLSEGADAASGFTSGIEALRVAFLVLGAVIALPIKLLSNLVDWLSKVGNMTLPELATAFKEWAGGIWDSIKGLFTTLLELGKNVISGFKEGLSNGFKSLGEFVKGLFTGLIEIVKKVLGIHSPSTVFIAIGAFVIAGLIIGIASMNDKLRDTLGQSIAIFADFAKAIAGVVIAILIGVAVFKMIRAITNIAAGIGNIFNSISSFFTSAGKALKTYAKQKFKADIIRSMGQTALMIAGSIALIIAAMLTIAKMSEKMPSGALENAIGLVGICAAMMAAFLLLVGLFVKFSSQYNMSSTMNVGGKLFEKIGVDIGGITTYTNTTTRIMQALGKALIQFGIAIKITVASVISIAKIMSKNEIDIGTMYAIIGMIAIITNILGSFVALSLLVQKQKIDDTSFIKLNKYLWSAVAIIASISALLVALSVANVSWSAVGQLAVVSALIATMAAVFIGLAKLVAAANIPMVALGKLALIVGIAVTAILTLTVSLALLGPALTQLVAGMETFEPYLLKFNENASTLFEAMGKFIGFAALLSVASVFLSVAFVNIGIGLSFFIPILLALMGLGAVIAKTFEIVSTAFEKAVDGMVNASKKFLKNYKLFKVALMALKDLMSYDLVGPISVLLYLSFAIFNLGTAGLVASGGLVLLIATVKSASKALDDIRKVLKFFEEVTWDQVLGMAKLAIGIGALGLAATLTAPGIATLALSVLLVATAVYVLSAAVVLLGNNMAAANAVLEFLVQHVNDFLTLVAPAEAAIAGLGISLAVLGVGTIVFAIGLALVAVATLALLTNFGIGILLLLAFNAALNKIKEDNPELYDSIMKIVKALGDMAETTADLYKLTKPILKLMVTLAALAIKGIIKIVEDFRTWWNNLWIVKKVKEIKDDLVKWWNETFIPWILSLPGKLQGAWEGIKEWWNNLWIVKKVKEIKDDLVKWWNETFIPWIEGLPNEIKTKLGDLGSNIIKWIKNGLGIGSGSENNSTSFKTIATDCINGFINGITGAYDTCKKAISDWAKTLPVWVQNILGISSPSKEFAYLGEMSVAGYVKGIEDNQGTAEKAMSALAKESNAAFCDLMGIHSASTVMYENGSNINKGLAGGIKDSADEVLAEVDKEVDDINKAFDEIEDPFEKGKTKKHFDLVLEKEEQDAKDYQAKQTAEDKTFFGMLKNSWNDLKSTISSLFKGDITIGQAFSAIVESLKKHGGTFLGDKIDALKNWLFGEGGILSSLGDFLKNPFEGFDLQSILDAIDKINPEDFLSKLDLSGVGNNVPDLTNVGSSLTGAGGTSSQSQYIFTQNNYSPKALSRLEIYRQTKRQFYDFRTQEELAK